MTKFEKNPWKPTKDIKEIKVLGKLGEETGELSSAASRCIIQGIKEKEPETKKSNKEWLEDEIADVLACSQLAIEKLNLNKDRIMARAEEKKFHLEGWVEMQES